VVQQADCMDEVRHLLDLQIYVINRNNKGKRMRCFAVL